MDDRMRFRSANARIGQLVNDPLIAEDVQLYAEQRSMSVLLAAGTADTGDDVDFEPERLGLTARTPDL